MHLFWQRTLRRTFFDFTLFSMLVTSHRKFSVHFLSFQILNDDFIYNRARFSTLNKHLNNINNM